MKKVYILGIALLLSIICVQVVLAEGLAIENIDAYIDGNKKTMSNSGGTTLKVDPESTLKIKIKIGNTFDSDTNNNMENVFVTGIISDIDDGDDLEEESDEGDIDAGKSKTFTFEFKIPLLVDADDYDFTIRAEGENSSGNEFNITEEYTVRVDKDKHKLLIRRAELSKSKVDCGKTVQVDVAVYNIGEEDEEDTVLSITNEELEINEKKTFDLVEDIDDDENSRSESFILKIPEDTEEGIYSILVKALYDGGSKSVDETLELEVVCEEEPVIVTPSTTPAETTTVITTPTTPTETTTVIPTAAVAVQPVSSGFGSSSIWYGAIVLAYIVVIGAIIIIAVNLLRKKGN